MEICKTIQIQELMNGRLMLISIELNLKNSEKSILKLIKKRILVFLSLFILILTEKKVNNQTINCANFQTHVGLFFQEMNILQKSYLPAEFSQPYIKNKDKVLCYRSDFTFQDLEDDSKEVIALFTSLQLSITLNFEESYLFRYKVNAKQLNSLNILSSEKHQTLCLYNFYIMNDMFLDYNPHVDLSRFYEKSNAETFLFIHLNKFGEIDWDAIDSYLNFRITKNINLLIKADTQNLEDLIENKIVIGSRNLSVTLFIHQVIENPDTTPALEFFEQLKKNNAFDSLEEAIQYYGFSKDQISDWSINDLLIYGQLPYMEDNKHRENIDGYRVFIDKHDNSPVAFLSYLKHFKQIHPNQDQKIKDFCINCKKRSTQCTVVRDNALKMPQLQPLNQLFIYPIDSKTISFINRILTRFIDRLIEWIRAENLIKIFSINANPYWIRQALCSSSVSPINNYEVLEVLGDSILKYITSIYLYFQCENENQLSYLRQQIINNKYLAKIPVSIQMSQYIMTKTHYQKHIENYYSQNYKTYVDSSKIVESQLADIYEALIGAVYQTSFSYEEVIRFLFDTNFALPLCQNDYIPSLIKTDHKSQIINFQNTSIAKKYPLDYFKQKYNLHFSLQEKNLEYFQSQVLQYQFKDKKLLVQALQFPTKTNTANYEKLEFLGDAIIETFLVSNVFQILYEKHRQNQISYRTGDMDRDNMVCPGMFTSIKISLLDNGFMATMSLLLGYHNQISDLPLAEKEALPQILLELESMQGNVNVIRDLTQKIPKSYGDVFESVAGAILLDGGWENFLQVYGRIYFPFIQYLTNNIEEIYKYDKTQLNLTDQSKK